MAESSLRLAQGVVVSTITQPALLALADRVIRLDDGAKSEEGVDE
ncbi:hypothetical protein ACFQH5_13220 [Halomonas salifodinae]|uniref:Uncharacterized protein n=1 Tax=Halomonas salifodinae TaxID=438745 RepID=A0ABW2EWZ4_9GAMM